MINIITVYADGTILFEGAHQTFIHIHIRIQVVQGIRAMLGYFVDYLN